MSASIDEVRASIAAANSTAAAANSTATESLGALQQVHSSLEQALGALQHATEGSGQADVSEATGLLTQAMESVVTTEQAVFAAIGASESVANRL